MAAADLVGRPEPGPLRVVGRGRRQECTGGPPSVGPAGRPAGVCLAPQTLC